MVNDELIRLECLRLAKAHYEVNYDIDVIKTATDFYQFVISDPNEVE